MFWYLLEVNFKNYQVEECYQFIISVMVENIIDMVEICVDADLL